MTMGAEVKERPILFSAPMVRAILAGTKTQTRRVVKPRKDRDLGCELAPCELAGDVRDGNYRNAYCAPGDLLWVREKFQPLLADGVEHWRADWETGEGYAISYPATDGVKEYIDMDDNLRSACMPSIHMPRWASRITLRVTDVRVERLQDISEADAIAEGTTCYVCGGPLTGHSEDDCHCFHRRAKPSDYRALWEHINGPGSWDDNPWVWAVSFERV